MNVASWEDADRMEARSVSDGMGRMDGGSSPG